MKTLVRIMALVAACATSFGCERTTGSASMESEPAAPDEVLVQEMQRKVVKAERLHDGAVVVTVSDQDAIEALFTMEFSAQGNQRYRHMTIPEFIAVEGMQWKKPPELDPASRIAFSVFQMIPRSTAAIAYDNTGCDLGAIGGASSCTGAGACCDTHDYCYYKGNGGQRCTAASWGCWGARVSLAGCNTLAGGPWACTTQHYNMLRDRVATCSEADLSDDCHMCNNEIVKCVGGAATGSPSGESKCCADNNCEEERPEDCEVQPDGRCLCPPGSTSAACLPQSNEDPAKENPPRDPPVPPGDAGAKLTGPVLIAVDPNDKVGPAGRGTEHVVLARDALPYVINFENVPPANATVQEVVVTDTLDPSLDPTSVSLDVLSFGGYRVSIPSGALRYERVITVPRDGCILAGTGDLAVKVSARFDPTTRLIEARLRVVDPLTGGWPKDDQAGILPPASGQCSQGYLSFQAHARAGLKPGTVVTNAASIVFDSGKPLMTNEVSNRVVGVAP